MAVSAGADNFPEAVSSAGPLPVRPRPIPNEAAIGYLIRVAQSNGFATPRQLSHSLQSRDTKVPFDELLDSAEVTI